MINPDVREVTRDNVGDIIDNIYNDSPMDVLRIFVDGEQYCSRNINDSLAYVNDDKRKIITHDDLAMLVLKTITEGDQVEYIYKSFMDKQKEESGILGRIRLKDFSVITVDDSNAAGYIGEENLFQYNNKTDELIYSVKKAADDEYVKQECDFERMANLFIALYLPRYTQNKCDITVA